MTNQPTLLRRHPVGHLECGKDPPHPPQRLFSTLSDALLPALFADRATLTSDAEQADLFLVPAMGTNMEGLFEFYTHLVRCAAALALAQCILFSALLLQPWQANLAASNSGALDSSCRRGGPDAGTSRTRTRGGMPPAAPTTCGIPPLTTAGWHSRSAQSQSKTPNPSPGHRDSCPNECHVH